MFYDESLMFDALTYIRPDNYDKSEIEREEDMRIRDLVRQLLTKKVPKPKKMNIIEEDQAVINESVVAESLFDLKSPDQFGYDEDDEIAGDKSGNPFSLRSGTARDIDENDELDEDGQPLGL